MSIVEIARKFKVSPVTVSNALNRRKGVAQELAEAIRGYAREVGYQPNYLARSLLSGRTGVVGLCLCIPPSTPWFGELLSQLQHQLGQAGFHLNTIVIDPFEGENHFERECRAVNFFRQIKAEAVLLGPCDRRDYASLSARVPEVEKLILFDAQEALPCAHVRLDVAAGTRLALDHLFERGHRRIGYLGLNRFDAVSESGATRYANYRRFLADHQLPFDERGVIATSGAVPTPETGETLKAHLLSEHRVSAFFCHDDNYAALAVKTAQEVALQVPRDLSLVGFDDQPTAWLTYPGITTVKFDQPNYVKALLQLVLAAVSGRLSGTETHVEEPVLIERRSVANG